MNSVCLGRVSEVCMLKSGGEIVLVLNQFCVDNIFLSKLGVVCN